MVRAQHFSAEQSAALLVLKRAGAESQVIIVHNWGRELREKTGSTSTKP